MSFTWDADKRKYKDGGGNFVADARLRGWLDDIASALTVLFMRRAQAVRAAFENIATDEDAFREAVRRWDIETRADISSGHILAAVVAVGGFQIATVQEYEVGEVAARFQLGFWEALLSGVASGSVALDERFLSRTGLYGAAIYSTFENAVRQREQAAGQNEERRILGAADHCRTCKDQAALKWQPIGTLKRIGDSECMSRCRCHFIFR